MEKLYFILTWGIVWIMLLGVALFVFIDVPKTEKLKNYKHTRYLLSGIYLLMAVANIAQLLGGVENNLWYSRILTLWVGCSMASSLTIINITLLNSSYFSYQRFFKELLPSLLLTVFAFFILKLFSDKSPVFLITYYFFLAFYIFLMGKFTVLLIKEFQKYRIKFDNYFSESESNHLSWILKTQIIATICGLLALISLFLPLWFMCFFSLFLILFYLYYAIRFLNYPVKFPAFEPLMEETVAETAINTHSFNQLEDAVTKWEDDKKFIRTDITIEFVARELYTNRTYLSNYINTYKNKSFKQWISDLRIGEAQRLLLSEPQVQVSDIAYRVGFSDKSNFTNRFSKNVGESPKKWRKIHLVQS